MSAGTRPELTIKEAADACGVSPKTIRRKLDQFPNARRLDAPSGPQAGPWVIPVGDLEAAGLKPGKPSPPDEPDEPNPTRTGTAADELRKRIDSLEADLTSSKARETELRHRAEIAETELEATKRNNDDLRATMRILEAGLSTNDDDGPETLESDALGAIESAQPAALVSETPILGRLWRRYRHR